VIPNVAAFPRKWPDACDDAEMIAWVPRSGERGYVGGHKQVGLGSNGPSFGEAWVPRSGERGYVDVFLRIWLQWAFYKSGFTGRDDQFEPAVFCREHFGFGHPFHGG
jgi:hypothetical protein